jgi:hypothetical protein
MIVVQMADMQIANDLNVLHLLFPSTQDWSAKLYSEHI